VITSKHELPGRKTVLTFTTTAERNEAAELARAAGHTVIYAATTGLVTVRPTFRETHPTAARVMLHAALAVLTCYGNLAFLAARYAYRRALPHYRASRTARNAHTGPQAAPWWAHRNPDAWISPDATQSTDTGDDAPWWQMATPTAPTGPHALPQTAHSNATRFTVTRDGTVYGYRTH